MDPVHCPWPLRLPLYPLYPVVWMTVGVWVVKDGSDGFVVFRFQLCHKGDWR